MSRRELMNALDNAMAALEALDEGDFLMGGGAFLDKAFENIEAAQMAAFQLGRSERNAGNRSPGGRVSRTKTAKKPRKPSAWNQFVSAEMPKVLKKHPRFTPQRAMKEVSKRWRSSPKNPNRRRRR